MRTHLARSATRRFRRWRWPIFVAVAILAIPLAGVAWYLIHRPSAASPDLQRAVTTYEVSPSFSPDGTRLAFAWDGSQPGKYDIYVRPATGGTPQRLTTDEGSKSNPAWSPDEMRIAFVKRNAGVFLMSSRGGAERKVSDSSLESSLAWMPNGKSLALPERASDAEPYRVVLVPLASGERRRLTAPAPGTWGDDDPAISPDGKNLCFVRWITASGASDLYVMPVDSGGEPRRLTSDGVWIYNPVWTPDGREIVFSSNRSGGQNLWRIPAAGGKPKRLDFVQGEVRSVALSTLRPGKSVRMAYSTSVFDDNVWRLDLTIGGKPMPVISSTARDLSAQFSPNGNRIAFSSDRSGSFEIWISRADGSLPVQVTSFGAGIVESPRWSPDGKRIALAALVDTKAANFTPQINRHVYVVNADGGIPRRLTSQPGEEGRPSFSKDGRWIYFRSDHTGTQQIWKASVDGGPPIQVTHTGGFEAFESPDGRLLYFTKGRTGTGLWNMPVDGGDESAVVDGVHSSYWGVAHDGIFFVDYNPDAPRTAHKAVKFFSFETRQVKEVAAIDKEIFSASPAFSVTPDGRSILWTQIDQRGAQLILVENFR